ncbi:MAG: TetR/AcrR family transcriptional regulator [Actinomycetota bacterium]|nr:TetR/AcrR family transcriptional regulator [Actinomycetota bacterium]
MSQFAINRQPAVNGHTTRRLETRLKLLAAATELFAVRRVPDVTSTAIAKHAGVATGTFYLHFPDKHTLFEELVDEALAEIRAQFQPAHHSPPSVDARRLEIDSMLDVVERRRDLIRAVFDRGETSELAGRIQDRIASGLESAYEQDFREQDIQLHPGAAAQARAAVLVRIVAWWAEDPGRARRDEIVDILMEMDPMRAAAQAFRKRTH